MENWYDNESRSPVLLLIECGLHPVLLSNGLSSHTYPAMSRDDAINVFDSYGVKLI